MVGDAHGAGLLAVVVTGVKIVCVIPREHGIGALMVLIPAHVRARAEIRAVVMSAGYRPRRKIALEMICHPLRVGREYDLVIVVDVHGHVSETQHGIRERRAVDDAHGTFEHRAARTQGVADRPGHALAHLEFAHPDGLAAVGVRLRAVLHRQECAGAVVMRDVPFDAAGNPRADQPDERGLDDVLVIDKS